MKKTATSRMDMTLPTWLKEALVHAAGKKGVSAAEYVKDALKDRVAKDEEKANARHV
jgi:predicted HicB family RNase H-like nuclease